MRRRPRTAAVEDRLQVLRAGVVGREQRREDRDEDEQADEDGADDRARVAAQAAERLRPQAALARLEGISTDSSSATDTYRPAGSAG